jgi:branched-chain amino acid aminotransferase
MIENIDLEKSSQSKIGNIDWENLAFGHVFSDHMFLLDYESGKWTKPAIKPYGNISMSPATAVLHYSQTIFEGMKAYKNSAGEVYLFRPEENAKRFNESARRMCMPEIDIQIFLDALKALIDLDRNWVPSTKGSSLYIRPFMIAMDPYVGIRPAQQCKFMIIACPVGTYYAEPLSVKIETDYSRAVSGGTGNVKTGGNYAGALYPSRLAQEAGFQQVIWTDAKEHKYIEEVSTMNIVFQIGDTLITPASSDTILAGITRRSVIDIARAWGLKAEERLVSIAEIIEALENNTMVEAFGAGTAVTIAPIKVIQYKGKDYTLPATDKDNFSAKVNAELDAIRYGEKPDPFNWMVKV